MKRIYALLLIFSGSVFNCVSLFSLIVGSDTTPSREPLVVFPAADSDNEMRGFATFESGFTLEDASTTCLFNSQFPVGGISTFNGGTLNLNLDLIFSSTALITNGGIINGNMYSIQLPQTNGTFVLEGMTVNNATVVCGSDITLNGTLRFGDISILDGEGKTIDCSSGSIAVAPGGGLLIINAVLRGIHTGALLCEDSNATLSLDNVSILQDATYSFTQGHLVIFNAVTMSGQQAFAYQSSQATTIAQNATWYFDSGMTFSYEPSSASGDLIVMEHETSTLFLEATTLASTATGLRLTRGIFQVDGTCIVTSDATVESEAIYFGDGINAEQDLNIQFLAESGLLLSSGIIVYNNVN